MASKSSIEPGSLEGVIGAVHMNMYQVVWLSGVLLLSRGLSARVLVTTYILHTFYLES